MSTGGTGAPFSRGSIRPKPTYRRAEFRCRSRGIRDGVHLYVLRHTMASLLLYLGESLKLVAARLGHSSETLVLTIYGHLQAGMDREATLRLADLLADGTRGGR